MGVYRLKFTPEAVQDITDAADFYEKQREGLGKRFRSLVKNKLILIKESPMAYACQYSDVRFALVDFFPYSIHFTVDQYSRIIQIHAVLCQFRNPVKFWKGFED